MVQSKRFPKNITTKHSKNFKSKIVHKIAPVKSPEKGTGSPTKSVSKIIVENLFRPKNFLPFVFKKFSIFLKTFFFFLFLLNIAFKITQINSPTIKLEINAKPQEAKSESAFSPQISLFIPRGIATFVSRMGKQEKNTTQKTAPNSENKLKINSLSI